MKSLSISIFSTILALTILTEPIIAQDHFGQTTQALNVASELIWTGQIPVCWETSGFANEKTLVRSAIANTWENESNVQFVSWGQCGSTNNKGIRIKINDEMHRAPHTVGLGRQLAGVDSGMILNFTFINWSPGCATPVATRNSCITSIAVHEFGHAMGFAHEQNRHDATCDEDKESSDGDRIVGVWDLSSVMNYCNPVWNNNGSLSSTDILGARVFYGVPQRLQTNLPNGSYNLTCRDSSADTSTLYATCKDRTGKEWKTSLSNFHSCTGDIFNSDGYLGCSNINPPTGSYNLTCRDSVMDNNVLHATCKTKRGDWKKTSLSNFNSCTSDIYNSDGNLDCLKNNPPVGSYRQTCRYIIADGNNLYANCRTKSDRWISSSIIDFSLCAGDIGNSDGLLRCINNLPLPGGSYQQSCRDIFVNGAIQRATLSATCKTIGGNWNQTFLFDFRFCSDDIANLDGKLICYSQPAEEPFICPISRPICCEPDDQFPDIDSACRSENFCIARSRTSACP